MIKKILIIFRLTIQFSRENTFPNNLLCHIYQKNQQIHRFNKKYMLKYLL